jgi:hypothetical protein
MRSKKIVSFLSFFGKFDVNYAFIGAHQRFLYLVVFKGHSGDSVCEQTILYSFLKTLPVNLCVHCPIFAHNYCNKTLYTSLVNKLTQTNFNIKFHFFLKFLFIEESGDFLVFCENNLEGLVGREIILDVDFFVFFLSTAKVF